MATTGQLMHPAAAPDGKQKKTKVPALGASLRSAASARASTRPPRRSRIRHSARSAACASPWLRERATSA